MPESPISEHIQGPGPTGSEGWPVPVVPAPGAPNTTVDQGTTPWVVDQQNTADLDYDTGGGIVNQAVLGLALPGAGGPVAGGTSANPVQVGDAGTSLSVDDGGGALSTDSADGAHVGLGATTDAEATGSGSVIAILKRLRTLLGRAATGTASSVPASITTVTVLASNALRLGATVYNDSNADLFLMLGSGASTTVFTAKMTKGSYYEVPFDYTGILTGVWSSASGNARVTELT